MCGIAGFAGPLAATRSPDHVLTAIRRAEGGGLVATLRNAYTDVPVERVVDDVAVEAGALPVDDLYHELRAGSTNGGETDPDALVGGRPQEAVHNSAGTPGPALRRPRR